MSTLGDDFAFPLAFNPHKGDYWNAGLTKREHFAALAMQGLLSDPNLTCAYRDFARDAVVAADALIAALNEEPQP